MTKKNDIKQILKPIDQAVSQAYISEKLQVSDVLVWVLSQVGQSDIFQSTFSISEEFLRRLFFIRKEGLIRKFTLVLDLKATNKTIKLWPFIHQTIEEPYLASNHSKTMLIFPANLQMPVVAVITSQNLTRGNRFESAVISIEKAVTAQLTENMLDLIKFHSIPLNDALRRKFADIGEIVGSTDADS